MSKSRAAWAEVLEFNGTERVGLLSASAADIAARLESRVESLHLLTGSNHPKGEGGGPLDVLILDGPEPSVDLPSYWALVRPGGRLVLVSDNPRSPLRLIDRATGKSAGSAVDTLAGLRERLSAAGCGHLRVHGLLRSSQSSPTVFRTDLPVIGDIVLSSAQSNADRGRKTAIALLRRLVRKGRANPLVPAWMIVASDREQSDGPNVPVGRIGVEHNEKGAVVLGPGPDAVEKSFPSAIALQSTKTALAALEEAGFDLTPRVLRQPSEMRLHLSWSEGSDIDGYGMAIDELAVWLERAGEVLGTMHRLTHSAPDGTVLVHGDFWLGALLRSGETISGVIDWDHCRRGDPLEDLTTLAEITTRHSGALPAVTDRLQRAIDKGYERTRGD